MLRKYIMTFRFKAGLSLLLFICVFALSGYTQENADEFRKTIEMADSYFSKGDYINAKASYQIAVRLAPEDQYPKDRLQQSLDAIKVQMYQNSLYTQKIQLADDLLGKNDLEAALKTYQEALSILPGDSYASGRVQEITNNMAGTKLMQENYQKSIIKGDQLIKDGNIENALAEYRNASSLKPAETYPKEKTAQLEKTLADRKNLSGTYESLMQTADVAISHNKYDEAIGNLEAALRLKPGENQATARLAEVKKLKAAWDSYTQIINDADNLYISKDFEEAKEKYLQAEAIKPADEYPKRMVEKIDIALMDIAKADRSSYEVTIALADKLFNEQDYERAIVEYKNALRFKPDEAYAKQRISDINNALNLRKSQEEAYKQSIAKADKFYNDQLFEDARDEYNRASGIKPLEQYPKVKVDEINTMLSKLASQRGVYINLIKGADRLFFSDEYVEAREQYRQASDLFPKEQYPLNQITMINEILGIRDKYDKSVTRADLLLKDKKYDEALLEYRNAASINPKEDYPVQKMKEIEMITAYNAKPQKMQKTEDKKLVADEDNAMTEEEYQEGLAAYKKEKVYEIGADSAQLVEIASNEEQYDNIISIADSALQEKNYQYAREKYQAAIKLKPGEIYAQGKIDGIDKTLIAIAAKEVADKQKAELAKQQAALAQKAALDKQYADIISTADIALQAKDYQKALTAYQSALNLKPGETYAQGKITEINGILNEIAAKEAAAKQQALLEQQRQAALAEQQAALDKQYADIISTADIALQANDYQKALTGYQSALNLKPGETYAQGKISEINGILNEIAAKEAAAKQQAILAEQQQAALAQQKAALDKQYADIISTADIALQAKDYQKALTAYQSALNLKPGETYAQGKITEINGILSEIAAKEAATKQQAILEQQQQAALAQQKAALDKQYTDIISTADIALQAKDYQKALTAYQSALNLKPGETYAQGKITEINGILNEIAAKEAAAKQQALLEQQQQAALAQQKAALDKQYADIISTADIALQAKDYQKALTSYQSALNLKPGESYAQRKITEINGKLAEIAAKDALEKQQEALDKQYADIISAADNAFQAKDYQNALSAYQSALNLKPNMPYVKGRIAEINGILIDIAAKEELAKQKAALDKQYADEISIADIALQAKEYQKALTAYQSAKSLKPDELYAPGKIAEINRILGEAAAKEALDKNYVNVISGADLALQSKDYDKALTGYKAALSLKPGESYPKDKISEVELIKEELRKQEEIDNQYNKIIAGAEGYMAKEQYEKALAAYQEALAVKPSEDLPSQRIAEINQKLLLIAASRDLAYQAAISEGDAYFEQQDFDNAKKQYEKALALKPGETYPKDKLNLVEAQIARKMQLIQADYDKAIVNADQFYNTKIYDNALESYRAASALKPDEAYPKEMAGKILKLLSERSIVQINKDPLLIASNTEHKFTFVSVPVKDRKSNYIFFRARNVSKSEYKLIISYGKDQTKNGGFVIKVPAGQDLYEFIVRISEQYKWFSDDNNWITFYPEGGDFEISLMQISYSD